MTIREKLNLLMEEEEKTFEEMNSRENLTEEDYSNLKARINSVQQEYSDIEYFVENGYSSLDDDLKVILQ